MAHEPQWAGLLVRLTQAPEHEVCPVGQVQAPAEQASPDGHERPQPLQFWLLVWRFVQTPPQFVRPAWQDSAQVPAEQTSPAGHT